MLISEAMDGGYIAGSKFVNFNELFSKQGTMKTELELKECENLSYTMYMYTKIYLP